VRYGRSFAAALMVVGLLFPSARAADESPLRWKFEKDKVFYQEITSETTQNLKIQNSDIKNSHKQTFIFSWKVTGQDKDNNWQLEQKIEGLKMEFKIGEQTVSFDSTKDSGGNNPLADFFKALIGSVFKLTVDKDGKVVKVEGKEDFIKKLINVNPQMEQLLKQIMTEESIRNMTEGTFLVGPAKADEKTWKRPTTLSLGPIGTYEVENTYTLLGPDPMNAKLIRVKIEPKLTYKPPTSNTGGLPFIIKSADIKTTKAEGFYLFDPEKGRVDSSELTVEMTGKLTIEIAGQTSTVDIVSQTQKTTVKNTDTNPIPPKK
jgi:hypothetical protein